MMNADSEFYDRGFFDTFFTSIGVFVTGVAASFVMIAIMMGKDTHSNWKNKEDESDDDSDDELPFVQRFYADFKELEEKELTDKEKEDLKTTFLEIVTNNDDKVVLRWDDTSNRFDYWCNNKNITYLELDACAQKYAIDNDCKSAVVDYKQEYDNAFEEWIKKNKPEIYEGAEQDEEDESDESDDEDDSSMPEENVFATFKNYNAEPVNKPKNDKPKITTKKSNQFRRMGSVTDYENEFVKKDNDKSATEENEVKSKLDYNEWKQSMQNTGEDNKKDK